MGWKSFLLCTLLMTMVVPRVVQYIVSLGYQNSVQRHYPGKCIAVPGTVNGSEDLELISDGLVLISSGLRFLIEPDNEAYMGRTGSVLLFDFNNPDQGAVPLTITGHFNTDTFNPHGMSVYLDDKGNSYLYIINQLDQGSVVEKFLVNPESRSLSHVTTFGLGDPAFFVLNDLAVVGEDRFYYTNYYWKRWMSKLDNWLRLTSGAIGYYDGEKGHISVPNLHKPNGLAASKDGKTIYVANFAFNSISVYKEKTTGALHLNQTIFVNSSPDNVIIHEEGDDVTLYAGCAQVLWKLRSYIHNPIKYISPSKVVRIRLRVDEEPDITDLLADDGRLVSGSSSALVHESKLLVGTVASHALLCDVQYDG